MRHLVAGRRLAFTEWIDKVVENARHPFVPASCFDVSDSSRFFCADWCFGLNSAT